MDKVYLVDIRKFNRQLMNVGQTQKKIQELGGNTGNEVWYECVKRRLIYDKELAVDDDFQEHGIYVIPVANLITVNNSWQLVSISKKWCGEGKRTVLLGLGAQLTYDVNTPRKLVKLVSEDVKEAIKRISLYGSIMVRGEITAECLRLIGVQSEILGCPSFYFLPEKMLKIYRADIEKVSDVGMSFDHYSKWTTGFLEWIYNSRYWANARWLMQTMWDMPLSLEGKEVEDSRIYERFPDTKIAPGTVRKKMLDQGMIFFDFDSWSAFYREHIDMLVGMKFHGNMMAAINGIPAVWITHDSRTEELCDTIALPKIDIKKISTYGNAEDVICEVLSKCDSKKYLEKFREFQSFLNKNQLVYDWDK